MTIQEAINSGKRVRRKSPLFGSAYGYIKSTPSGVKFEYTSTHYPSGSWCELNVDDILADDWEVEVTKKYLSAEDIRTAHSDSVLKADIGLCNGLIDCIIKNLGLE